MPVYNVTVDDSSPMFIYSQGWIDSNSSDPKLSEYSGGTFHATSKPGETATFSFFGSAVYLFGARRENYGPFGVSIDGQDSSGISTVSGSPFFHQLLFSRTGLSKSKHTLILTNNGSGTSVDVDYIIFTTGDDSSTTQPRNSTTDDTAPQIIYTGPSDWDTTSSFKGSYHNESFHESQIQGARVVVPFTGNAVSIYGSTSQNHGTFSVRIDGRDSVVLNGSAPIFRPQTLLYWGGGFGPGEHRLELTNAQDQLYVDFDFLVSTLWTPLANHSKSKTPIIAGVISGTCVGIAWMIALFYLLRRRLRKRRNLLTSGLDAEIKPEPFILPPDPAVADGSHRPGEYAFRSEPSAKARPPPSRVIPVPSNSRTPAPTSSSSQSRTKTRSPDSHAYASTPDASSSVASLQPLASSSALASSYGAAVPSVPDSSSSRGALSAASRVVQSDPRQNMSIAELSASRLNVPNRPQDWGPVIPLQDDDEGLPPDYQQATQPMPSVATSVERTAERPNT